MATRNGARTFLDAFPQAHSLWAVDVPRVGTIEAFALGSTIVLIQDYGSGDGWNAFTPTTDEGEITKTLAAIGVRCNVNQ
jgi:hypothetical protein